MDSISRADFNCHLTWKFIVLWTWFELQIKQWHIQLFKFGNRCRSTSFSWRWEQFFVYMRKRERERKMSGLTNATLAHDCVSYSGLVGHMSSRISYWSGSPPSPFTSPLPPLQFLIAFHLSFKRICVTLYVKNVNVALQCKIWMLSDS